MRQWACPLAAALRWPWRRSCATRARSRSRHSSSSHRRGSRSAPTPPPSPATTRTRGTCAWNEWTAHTRATRLTAAALLDRGTDCRLDLLSKPFLESASAQYLNGAPLDPYNCPSMGSLKGLGRAWIDAGANELFVDDITGTTHPALA